MYIIIFITSNSINAAVITIGKDTKINFVNTQFYVLGNEKVPTITSISGSDNGYIFANDLCTIKSTDNSKYWKVEYPISTGKKTSYVNKSYILNNLSYSKSIKINANDTVYTKSDMKTKFGTVYKTDIITILSPVKDGKAQILYNVSNGYKIGWIKVSDSEDTPKPNLNSSYYTTPNNVFTKGQCTWYTWGRAWEKLGSKLSTESVKGYSGVSPNNTKAL